MDLSIVIPTFNEAGKIENDITQAAAFLKSEKLKGEIIISDDGSTDETITEAENAGKHLPENIDLRILNNPGHKGKGRAVRTGICDSKGDIVLFADCGCCVPFENAFRGIELFKNNQCDIAHGSRKLKETEIIIPQSLYRRICSRLFHFLVVSFMGIPNSLTDTQCGFKVYRGDIARKLYNKSQIDGFMFDIEIILLALKSCYKIREFPIRWNCDRDSRLTPARNIGNIISELKKIRKDQAETTN
jgi:dolichyl-phosphate beta-glucosyltransferase